ncbi:class IIb bacteriocin, lactobin A/cerein 7B family [Muricauda ruestringensis]|uniref:Class IIb bacteriocin, lactobin A/cerein 7B family n=1 Tax=Flagellimonas aurea TaxID=2915619 RepID=A0ABS3G139_9FLAO|nr:class IIb bacteriocin, lactobin A/cerein 7B family [Allomuricauda aurea]MBO0353129.1 class IIb bacteriocin, lactobin A/cerein 7B family [Allomuricauda aurea]
MLNNLKLEKYNVIPLEKKSLKSINGGILPIIVGIIVFSMSIGYADGRRDKQ